MKAKLMFLLILLATYFSFAQSIDEVKKSVKQGNVDAGKKYLDLCIIMERKH